MKLNVYSKEVRITSDIEERIENRLSFLDRYVAIDSDTVATANIKKHGNDVKLEITVPSKIGTLRAEAIKHQLTDAIDIVTDKIEDQIRKQKARLTRKHREKLSKAFVEELDADYGVEQDEKIIKTKRVLIEEMDQDEAIVQMELLGHDFFAFKDKDTGVSSILYKRKDGGYGILELV